MRHCWFEHLYMWQEFVTKTQVVIHLGIKLTSGNDWCLYLDHVFLLRTSPRHTRLLMFSCVAIICIFFRNYTHSQLLKWFISGTMRQKHYNTIGIRFFLNQLYVLTAIGLKYQRQISKKKPTFNPF